VLCVSQALNRHNYAYADRECDNKYVTTPGNLQWRDGGEKHMNDPITVSNLQVTNSSAILVHYCSFIQFSANHFSSQFQAASIAHWTYCDTF